MNNPSLRSAVLVGSIIGALFWPIWDMAHSTATPTTFVCVYGDKSEQPPCHWLPRCTYEDGNPNGELCVWIDPDTGEAYYVDSHNYR